MEMVFYVLAIILLTGVTIFVSTLFVIGIIQGTKEPVNLAGLCAGGTSLPENRIQHIDCWGTWDGYTTEENGVLNHYDAFGNKTGTSRRV